MIVLPIFDLLLLPGVVFSFKKDVLSGIPAKEFKLNEEVLFLIQKTNKRKSDLGANDIFDKGIIGVIENVDDEGTVGIRAMKRVDIYDLDDSEGFLSATASVCHEPDDMPEAEEKEIYKEIRGKLLTFVQRFPWGVLARNFIQRWNSVEEIGCAMAGYLPWDFQDKYNIMKTDSPRERVNLIVNAIEEFMVMTEVGEEAEEKQKEKNDKIYRESAIRKQIEILQQELDEMHPENISDVRKFEKKLEESGMNEEARKEADKVLHRMKQEGKDGHEYGMLYDYLDFVTSLDWKKAEMEDIDLNEAQEILDEDHYGLEKVKDRIIQQIAVMALNKKQSGSILLFTGAPGTGKTSIGKSIAKALHREYVRISLGGIRDEAEIRGHRRTYIGAMPGRIMDGMKRSGVSNPVIVLDEVDKLAREYNGDPASALLEVLDPEQNFSFTDHYMNVPYDLSDVLFVCTANTTESIPEPLLNRMEVIPFPGYTAIEKFQIARKHLLPNAMEETGIRKSNLKVTDDALKKIISEYTAEAGVRGLKKQMSILCRHAAVKLVRGDQKSITVGVKKVEEYLGHQRLVHETRLEKAEPGIVTGLAWTRAGGEILFIETLSTRGEGKLQVTGQLGDVMKESVQIAWTLVKSMFPNQAEKFADRNIHVHVPAGATPKDGPSAGITLSTALVSLILDKAVGTEYAMTGEVSLQGNVMPIGGLPEKLMAAERAGIKTVFIPEKNREDLVDVAEEVKKSLQIIPVKRVEQVWREVGLLE